jgi:release factor glutamine methyltransferase
MILGQWIQNAKKVLISGGSPSPAADVKCIVCHVLGVETSWIIIHDDFEIPCDQEKVLNDMISARAAGKPVAYIIGHRGFWSLDLRCSECTLIPQPDTETLVETALKHASNGARVLDLATGTGAVALAMKSERPDLIVEGCDVVPQAVELADENARLNCLDVAFYVSDWFSGVKGKFNLITANPPYISSDDPHLSQGDVRFEPLSALVAGDDGLADLRYIISTASEYLVDGGVLLLEHGYNQADVVRDMFASSGYSSIDTVIDFGGNPRVTYGFFRKQ